MKHLKIGRDKPVSKCMNLDYTMQLTDQASAENATQTGSHKLCKWFTTNVLYMYIQIRLYKVLKMINFLEY